MILIKKNKKKMPRKYSPAYWDIKCKKAREKQGR